MQELKDKIIEITRFDEDKDFNDTVDAANELMVAYKILDNMYTKDVSVLY